MKKTTFILVIYDDKHVFIGLSFITKALHIHRYKYGSFFSPYKSILYGFCYYRSSIDFSRQSVLEDWLIECLDQGPVFHKLSQ